mmetsp:Transcript_85350/g.217518  ORF Transcript_85350/g.217518 Transcript_85350/m.217518 type:complete len:168 (-) Transcript_85350:96-599(-)
MAPSIASLEEFAALSGLGMSGVSLEQVELPSGSGFKGEGMSRLDLAKLLYAGECPTEVSTLDVLPELSEQAPAQPSGALEKLAQIVGLEVEELMSDFHSDAVALEEKLVNLLIIQGDVKTSMSRAEVALLLNEIIRQHLLRPFDLDDRLKTSVSSADDCALDGGENF